MNPAALPRGAKHVMPATAFGGGSPPFLGNWLALTETPAAPRGLLERLPDLHPLDGDAAERRSPARSAPRCAGPPPCTSNRECDAWPM